MVTYLNSSKEKTNPKRQYLRINYKLFVVHVTWTTQLTPRVVTESVNQYNRRIHTKTGASNLILYTSLSKMLQSDSTVFLLFYNRYQKKVATDKGHRVACMYLAC